MIHHRTSLRHIRTRTRSINATVFTAAGFCFSFPLAVSVACSVLKWILSAPGAPTPPELQQKMSYDSGAATTPGYDDSRGTTIPELRWRIQTANWKNECLYTMLHCARFGGSLKQNQQSWTEGVFQCLRKIKSGDSGCSFCEKVSVQESTCQVVFFFGAVLVRRAWSQGWDLSGEELNRRSWLSTPWESLCPVWMEDCSSWHLRWLW